MNYLIKQVSVEDKDNFNKLAPHPLQSWEWGEFRQKTGNGVIRLGRFDHNNLVEAIQMTLHPVPFTSWKIGYIPKSKWPSEEMFTELIKVGKKCNLIFIKLEPNIIKDHFQPTTHNQQLITRSPHPLFTRYTFRLDLTKSLEGLLKDMHNKTRYNIKVAMKNQVMIREDRSPEAFREYLKLTMETTNRQGFFAHDRHYHEIMWDTLKNSESGGLSAHLFTANYKDNDRIYILVTWIVFLFNNILYYPYGASSSLFRNTMASNLMMWEVIKWGKEKGATLFDMWGSLGPDPDPLDPWYGFHKFKMGYHPDLVEFIGSFDLVIYPILYKLYNAAYTVRQRILKIRSKI